MRDDRRSPEAEGYRRLYKTARWRQVREAQLLAFPLCQRCSTPARPVVATVCNHLDRAAKATEAGFFAGPFTSLCKPCHDGPTQQQEAKGYSTDVGADGLPTDPNHPFNRA